MAQNAHLQPRTKRVFELLLAGQFDEAERFIDGEFRQQIEKLDKELRSLHEEQGLLVNAVILSRRGSIGNSSSSLIPRRIVVHRSQAPNTDQRREIILEVAGELASKNDGLVSVQSVVDELNTRGIKLGMDKPNTSVGNMLYRSDEWERKGVALFRYVGGQLDLGANR